MCGAQFTIEHALSCHCGGYTSIRHNEGRDITADIMTEVCHGVGVEPHLQPVTGEHLTYRTANKEDGARLDQARRKDFLIARVYPSPTIIVGVGAGQDTTHDPHE